RPRLAAPPARARLSPPRPAQALQGPAVGAGRQRLPADQPRHRRDPRHGRRPVAPPPFPAPRSPGSPPGLLPFARECAAAIGAQNGVFSRNPFHATDFRLKRLPTPARGIPPRALVLECRCAMSDDSFFREVDQELRQDRAKALWDRYGTAIIAAAIAVVVATSAVVGWDYWSQSRA